MTSATYNVFQQVFSLSLKTNSGTALKGGASSIAASLKTSIGAFLSAEDTTAALGTWTLAWGPAVWQATFSDVADNVMAVYSNGAGTYVVAIAGTNPYSTNDIVVQDLAVKPAYMGQVGPSATDTVSYGTIFGLKALQSLTSGNDQTLQSFLTSLGGGNTIIFTGHSLGGALSPALAYTLYPNGGGGNTVQVYPTAGPSTGNGAFAAAFNKAFPKTQDSAVGTAYAYWNANVFNSLDVVPAAWAQSNTPNLNKIPSYFTYSKQGRIEAYLPLLAAVDVLEGWSGGRNSPYTQLNNAEFIGTPQNTAIGTLEDVGIEALYQHVEAYVSEFGVAALFPATETVAVQTTLVSSLLEAAADAPVAQPEPVES